MLVHVLVVPTGTFGFPVGLRLDMSNFGVMVTSYCSGYSLVVGAGTEVTFACANANMNSMCYLPSTCLLWRCLLLVAYCMYFVSDP